MSTTHLLAIDDDPQFLTYLKASLDQHFSLFIAATFEEGIAALATQPIDLVLLDIGLGTENGLSLITKIKQARPSVDIVMVTGFKDTKLMIDAIRLGAADFLVKPFEFDEVVAINEKLAPYRTIREKHSALVEEVNESFDNEFIVGRSELLLTQLRCAQKLRGQNANVLIEGESGTGKELFARYIQGLEGQPARPFIAINCAAIPENLLESELFGHEKGAFTGASERKIGKFELANGGDLFLDEISSLKWDLQAKILRAIQEQEVVRIGSTEPIKVAFRVLAATNESLEQLVVQEKFRRDLFHRLRVVGLRIPPLRERQQDIPLLADLFLKKHVKRDGWSFNRSALFALQQYHWPGNVRELENLVQSLAILVRGPTISVSDLPEWMFHQQKSDGLIPFTAISETAVPASAKELMPLKDYVSKAEQVYIRRAIELTNGDKSKAAAMLQMSRTRLYERLRLWGWTTATAPS